MLKKIICILLGLVSIFLFCGCSEINYMQAILPNGSILENTQIKVDKRAVESAGMDYTYVLNCAKEEMEEYFSNPEFMVFGVQISSTTVNYYTGEVSKYITFANYDVYCEVYGIDPDEETEKEIESGLFWDKEILLKNKLLYADVVGSWIYDAFVDRIEQEYPDLCGFDFSDVDCYYCYGVPLTYARVERLRSNCTYFYDQELGGGTERFFVWEYNHNDADREMVIYKNVVHLWVWYATGIVLTLIFIIILIIVHYARKKKDREPEMVDVSSETI